MKTIKRIFITVLVLAILGGIAYGAKTVYGMIEESRNAVQEEDTTRWADFTSDDLNIEGIADATAKYTEAIVSTRLNVVFNSLFMSRETRYFTAPNGVITITASATEEGSLGKFKIAVWKKTDGGTQYVDGSTGYFKTDGKNYRYVVQGLDPSSSYRLTISYDSSKYYLNGIVQVEGVAE